MHQKRAAAIADHGRSKAIELYLTKHGPLYMRAVVPDYAKADFERNNYSAWSWATSMSVSSRRNAWTCISTTSRPQAVSSVPMV